MDLIAAQPHRPWRQPAYTSIRREGITDAAPGQMSVHLLPECISETRPLDSLGLAIGRLRRRPSAGSRAASFQICVTFLCNTVGRGQRDCSRTAAISSAIAVDLPRREASGACEAGEAREPDVGSPARKSCEQIN